MSTEREIKSANDLPDVDYYVVRRAYSEAARAYETRYYPFEETNAAEAFVMANPVAPDDGPGARCLVWSRFAIEAHDRWCGGNLWRGERHVLVTEETRA